MSLLSQLRHRYPATWKLFLGLGGVVTVFVVGVAGYMTIEGWNFVDAFYMVVITLSTTGFQEVQPLSDKGRIFTSFLILGGVGMFVYLAGAFTELLVEGRLQRLWRRYRMQKRIGALKHHFIVCGYGRIGSVVVGQIRQEGHPVVVVERDPAMLEKLDEQGILYVAGDATSDEILRECGLEKASSLITALTQEAANVYVTLTARQINPKLKIIARADSETHIPRLERAGADRVVLPHLIGGMRMAQSVLRPSVTNFLELAMRGGIDLQMEEATVCPDSELVGKNLAQSGIRPRFNVIIVSIKQANGEMEFNPGPETVIHAGATLITVGKFENLRQLRAMCTKNEDD